MNVVNQHRLSLRGGRAANAFIEGNLRASGTSLKRAQTQILAVIEIKTDPVDLLKMVHEQRTDVGQAADEVVFFAIGRKIGNDIIGRGKHKKTSAFLVTRLPFPSKSGYLHGVMSTGPTTIHQVNSLQEALERADEAQPLVLILFEVGCRHCQAAMELVALSEFDNDEVFCALEISRAPELLTQHGITGVPAFLIYIDGKLRQTLTSLPDIEALNLALSSADMKKEREEISSRLREPLAAIEEATQKFDRKPGDVRLLLATKGVSNERIRAAVGLGCKLVGENTAQELKSKQPELHSLGLEWHFIGHLQSNKVKDVVDRCELIHSLDRMSLAQELHKHGTRRSRPVRVLVEVNTSREPAKSGLNLEEAESFCKYIASLSGIEVCGLMTVAVDSEDKEKVRSCFRELKMLFDRVAALNFGNFKMKELSMGMSGDYKIALEEGATIIRLGSAIFGPRRY